MEGKKRQVDIGGKRERIKRKAERESEHKCRETYNDVY